MAARNNITLSSVLIVGAMIVAAPRYTGILANSEGWRITGMVWDWIVALSGVGMALLEGVATWWMWQSWADTQPSKARNVLTGFMVASGVALLVMVGPYVQASSSGLRVSQVLSSPAMWVWSGANALAPLLVMAGVGLAERLRKNDTTQPAIDIQALRDELRADIARIERKQTLHAVQVNVSNATPMQQDVQSPMLHDATAQPLQLTSGMTWDAALQHLAERNEDATPTRMAALTGCNKSTASRRLAKAVQL